MTDAPSDYAELFTDHYEYIRGLLHKDLPISWDEADDMAMEVLTKIIERDYIAMFNPDFKSKKSKKYDKPIPFRSFLTGIVKTYAMGYRQQIQRRKTRFLLLMDRPITPDGDETFADLITSEVTFSEEVERNVDMTRLLDDLEDKVITRPSQGRITYADAFGVFREVIESGDSDFAGGFSRLMQSRHKISSTAASAWKAKIVRAVQENF